MSSVNKELVAALLRQIGNGDEILSQAFIDGAISCSGENENQIKALHKAKLILPDEEFGDYRLTSDLKRLLNKLLRQQSGFRMLTDMGKAIDEMEQTIEDYRRTHNERNLEDAQAYLDQFDEIMDDTKESLESSIDAMHESISSQFGFVNSLTEKVIQNKKALIYAQNLINELQQIDPEQCYEWLFDGAPSEIGKRITGFIGWYRKELQRISYIIEKMRQSLFRLRHQVKQANLLKSMARYLRQHSEYEISEDFGINANLPEQLKLAPALLLTGFPDVNCTAQESALQQIVQQLRKINQLPEIKVKETTAKLELEKQEIIEHEKDWALDEIERYFEKSIDSQTPINALDFYQQAQVNWQQNQWYISPKLWLELIFSYYCNMPNSLQKQIQIELKETLETGTNNNFTYSDITIHLQN